MDERDHDDAHGAQAGPTGSSGGREPAPGGVADPPAGPGARRRVLLVAGAVAAVAVVVVLLALGARDAGTGDGARAGATGTATTPRGTASGPSSTPTTPAPTPSPGATTAAPTADAPGAPAAAPAAPVPVPPLGEAPPAVGTGTAPVGTGELTVAVPGVEAVATAAEGVGEVAGPGIAVAVEVRGPAGTRLDAPAVAAYAGAEGAPLRPAASDGRNAPLPAALPAEGVARGTYVFAAPPAGAPLAVSVLLRLDAPAVVVQGLLVP